MKTKILGLATLSMLFAAASCTNETSESANDGKQLKFKTALGKQTVSRAAEFTNASWINGDELTVYSFLTGSTTAFHEFDLTYNSVTPAWEYDDPVMSTGAFVRYYSWYPAGNTTTGTLDNTSYSFSYTVQEPGNQEDLIAATVTSNGYDITLPFKHVLSQVNFGIVETLGIGIEITNIKVSAVKNAGTYTFGAGTPWELGGTISEYNYTPVAGSNVTDGLGTGISYMGNTGTTVAVGVTPKNDNTNALMLMPQEFAAGSAAAISFQYRLTTKDASGNAVYTPSSDGYNDVTINLNDDAFAATTWLPGKRYLYLFDFSSFFTVDEIRFSVTVDGWVDDDEYPQTIEEQL